jgi:pyruvate formate lyase activating enzyme
MEEKKGVIFNIQRFSLHDGPGIRTAVFLKGCNLRCKWCHNPESFTLKPELSVNFSKCVSCGICVPVCSAGLHTIEENGRHKTDFEKCALCGKCADACPADVISVIGREYTADEVIKIVMKDKIYYENGGGVTFSGGEPFMQYDFLLELLKKSKENGLHICIETNGIVGAEKLETLCPFVDLFLYDFKHSDDEQHIKYTGFSNKTVLKNLDYLNRAGKEIILRCPVIPSINDTKGHFSAIRELKEKYPMILDIEIMPYHTTGVSKWENIGKIYELADICVPSKEQVNDL